MTVVMLQQCVGLLSCKTQNSYWQPVKRDWLHLLATVLFRHCEKAHKISHPAPVFHKCFW